MRLTIINSNNFINITLHFRDTNIPIPVIPKHTKQRIHIYIRIFKLQRIFFMNSYANFAKM